ncbi:CobW family GTP-binding protein [Paracoccus beibuensis]|uniref:CobW family GTP-binding protein n=1 Tax=Paracoccus beibuensis TaxID=547602 RepID=UPI00223FD69C|nr:CobW family GTP-binding protein [Paracoccus beibuensis]
MKKLPLLVIGGYLGAGKTTLIRHLLQNSDGLRLLVLVNDFGSINIDADLIAAVDGETIALSNGCVCCAMTGDLYYAIGDALDRVPRPDLLVVEASGVGDPARIAAVARAEPELRYSGTVTVADAQSIGSLLNDPQIGAQVAGQLSVADLIVLSRPDLSDLGAASDRISRVSRAELIPSLHGQIDVGLLTGLQPTSSHSACHADHNSAFVKWSGHINDRVSPERLDRFLNEIPVGVFRLKGWISLPDHTLELHRVGLSTQKSKMLPRGDCSLVAIAPSGRFDPAEMQHAWRRMTGEE